MFLTTTEWLERVKTDMEELTPDWDRIITQTGGSDIEQYIRAKWPEALTHLLAVAPEHLCIGNSVDITSQLSPEMRQDGSGRVVLPDDMLRMLRFKMNGWRRPVTRFVDRLHPTAEKPVAVISSDEQGRLVLDYFSLPPYMRRHEVKSAIYIPLPQEKNEGYDLHPLLGEAACYLCAALVFDILGQSEKAAIMRKQMSFN